MLHVNKSLKERLLSGGVWSFFAKGSASFLTVALAAIIVRLLSPDDVGVFFLSYSIIVLLSFLARFGIDQFCVRYIGHELAEKRYLAARDFIKTILLLVFGFSFIISVLLYFLSDLILSDYLFRDDLDFNISIYLAIWLPVTAIQFLFAEIFRSYHNIKYASIFAGGTIFGGFLSSLLFGIVVSIGYATGSSFYLEEILQILFSIIIFLLFIEYKIMRSMVNQYCELDGQSGREVISVKEILYESYPFFISALSLMLLLHADTIILGLYEPEAEVAVYNAATRIAKLMLIISMILIEVTTPVIVELNIKGDKKKLENMLRATATIATIPSVIILLYFIFFAEFVLGAVYGEYYESGALLLVIMSVGQLGGVWAGPGSYVLNMLGFQKASMYISLIISVIAIVICAFIAPIYGAVAVVLVTAVAYASKCIISMLYVYKLTGLLTCAKVFFSQNDIKKLAQFIKF